MTASYPGISGELSDVLSNGMSAFRIPGGIAAAAAGDRIAIGAALRSADPERQLPAWSSL
jgi:uncharacterized Zn-binding protein involved in type VI secretion